MHFLFCQKEYPTLVMVCLRVLVIDIKRIYDCKTVIIKLLLVLFLVKPNLCKNK